MIPVADPFMAGVRPSGLQRGRGGFLRSADDAPYVTDPSGEVCKTGDRKGEVKRLKYGSPSNRGLLVEPEGGLLKHKQRYSVLGFGIDPSLAESCKQLIGMDFESQEYRDIADGIMARAERIADGMLAADRGTHGHAITELWDRGGGRCTFTADFIAMGEAVGLDKLTQLRTSTAWSALLRDNGLEILAIEASCVDDKWRLAGTLDRIVRTTKPLTFVKPGGELVVVPADTVLVLDIKFGKCRLAHPIQIASYAQSLPYDVDTEHRGIWPWPIDQTHALIAHGDFGDDTRPVSIELVWVDLVAGREHGGQCVVDAKAWAARDDVFSISQIVEGVAADRSACKPTPSTPSSAGAPEPSAPLTVGEEAGAAVAGHSPTSTQGEPWTVVDECTGGFDCKSAKHIHGCDNDRPCPHEAHDLRLALVDARNTLTAEPDQGGDLTDDEYAPLWEAMRAQFDTLDPAARTWRSGLVSEAQRRHVPFHVQQVRTERTYWINKGLIALCHRNDNSVEEWDEILRALLALVVGDVALFPAIHPGHVVGSLTAAEAERFAVLVDTFNGPGLAAYIDDDSVFRLKSLIA